MAECNVCFRHCDIKEGKYGFCRVRTCDSGVIHPVNYGMATSLALDPIEKKPFARFRPGTRILSVGSYGCNLQCPFCQNHEISWPDNPDSADEMARFISPEELSGLAAYWRKEGNIGVAFTYNEPLVAWEYVRDTARLVKESGMVNVLVTNGTADSWVLDEIAPYIDAMNIDLKGFSEHYYSDVLKGSLDMTKAFISRAVRLCHVELTTLIVPGENDSDDEMRRLSKWVASLTDADGRTSGKDIPLHISRFFPRFHMTDRKPTPVRTVYRLADIAREYLSYVYTGNC